MLDYLVVGLGIAGINVAKELEERKKTFKVIDPIEINATQISGGIINPLIFKRYTKAWGADLFLPQSQKRYEELQKTVKESFYHPIPFYRIIQSIQEQNEWVIQSDSPALAPFMEPQLKTTEIPCVIAPYSYGKVNGVAYLNTTKLLTGYRAYLTKKELLQTENMDYQQLELKGDFIKYRSLKAKKIICCEGVGMLKNPLFKTLPLIKNKGEYLILKIPKLNLSAVIKNKATLIPLGKDRYKFGATYSRTFKNEEPQQDSKDELTAELEKTISCAYTLEAQEAGIRPTVLDRRPLIGRHPEHPNVLLLNGLGTHGLMMAPTAAKWLLDFDLEGKKLPKAVNVQRYF